MQKKVDISELSLLPKKFHKKYISRQARMQRGAHSNAVSYYLAPQDIFTYLLIVFLVGACIAYMLSGRGKDLLNQLQSSNATQVSTPAPKAVSKPILPKKDPVTKVQELQIANSVTCWTDSKNDTFCKAKADHTTVTGFRKIVNLSLDPQKTYVWINAMGEKVTSSGMPYKSASDILRLVSFK